MCELFPEKDKYGIKTKCHLLIIISLIDQNETKQKCVKKENKKFLILFMEDGRKVWLSFDCLFERTMKPGIAMQKY